MLKIRKNATWARLAMQIQLHTFWPTIHAAFFGISICGCSASDSTVCFILSRTVVVDAFFCPPVLSICFIFSPVQWICFAFMRWYISVDLGEGLIMCHVLVVYIECNSKLENLISFLVVELNDFRFTLHFLFIHFCCPCSNHAIIFWLNVLIHYHGHIFMCIFKCVFIIC